VIVYEDMIRKHQITANFSKTMSEIKINKKEPSAPQTARYKSKEKSPAPITLYTVSN
jgi:hypothetical protein